MTSGDHRLADRIGIYQGRLVESPDGSLQCAPGPRWRDELERAAALGLSHVEWYLEAEPEPANALWSASGRAEVGAALRDLGLAPVSCCSEESIARSLADPDFAADLGDRLATLLADVPFGLVVIPLEGESDPRTVSVADLARGVAVLAVAVGADRPVPGGGVQIALEAPVPSAEVLAVAGATAGVGVCCDLGNLTAAGLDPATEIRAAGARLLHVHAKDRDVDGTNVAFGTGRVDFARALAALVEVGYGGHLTMEATRGDDPVATAATHRAFLVDLLVAAGA